jgi:hypothetical protein
VKWDSKWTFLLTSLIAGFCGKNTAGFADLELKINGLLLVKMELFGISVLARGISFYQEKMTCYQPPNGNPQRRF